MFLDSDQDRKKAGIHVHESRQWSWHTHTFDIRLLGTKAMEGKRVRKVR